MRTAVLLRAVNVGGHNRVPMAELREVLTAAGHDHVVSYIQSGNIVLTPRGGLTTDALATEVAEVIEVEFGVTVSVIARDLTSLRRLVDRVPEVHLAADPAKLMAVVLSAPPSASAVAVFDPNRWAPDQMHLVDDNLYAYFPNGMGRSKFSVDVVERQLGVRGTARNWNTITRVLEMAATP